MNRIRLYMTQAVIGVLGFTVIPEVLSAQGADQDLSSVSLEDLMDVHVTSVSRHEEELRSTAAAVYVITQEDIRRSGVSDVTELLRMVPGMNVSQLTSSTWAVSARGFADQYSTKLLVQVDGRSIYDPDFSGVFWNLQNLVLEDIEKIEVVRGPGGTMWGANAVNGVINITTKRASETQGGLFVADSGVRRPAEGVFRYGTVVGKDAFLRVFGRQTTRGPGESETGSDGGDGWNLSDGGFRLDWGLNKKDALMVEGDVYRGVSGDPLQILTSLSPVRRDVAGLTSSTGGHILSRWNHAFSNASNLTVQVYFDHRSNAGYGAKKIRIFDFDLQHTIDVGRRNSFIWGLGRRENFGTIYDSLSFGVNPGKQDTDLTTAFAQDELAIVPGKLAFTAGAKVEHSTLTGWNVQPTGRLAWTPNIRHSTWASVSRAVRTANRVERGMHVNFATFDAGSLTGLVNLYGQPDTRNEGLVAYETGYRYQANRRLWLDTTAFYNVYDHLSTTEAGSLILETQPQPYLIAPLYFGNRMKGETYGIESAVNYKVNDTLAFRTSLSLLRMALHGYGAPVSSEGVEGQSPRQQAYFGAFLNLPQAFEVSAHTYVVGALSSFQMPRYTRVDVNLTWKRFENVQFSVATSNLLGQHTEFGNVDGPVNPVNRSAYGKVTWRF